MDNIFKFVRSIDSINPMHALTIKTCDVVLEGSPVEKTDGIKRCWSGLFTTMEAVPRVVWTLLSLALSIAVYSRTLGWAVAAGLMGLLLIHEFGHLMAAAILRIPSGPPIFIPYVGAIIDIQDVLQNRWKLALIGIAGPIAGTIGSLGCFICYKASGHVTLAFIALGGCVQNLFNLIPLGSLDGGHVVGVFARWIWIPGYLLMCSLAWFVHGPVIWISLLVMLPQVLGVFRRGERIRVRGMENYRRPNLRKRIMLGMSYLGLITILSCTIALILITGGVPVIKP